MTSLLVSLRLPKTESRIESNQEEEEPLSSLSPSALDDKITSEEQAPSDVECKAPRTVGS